MESPEQAKPYSVYQVRVSLDSTDPAVWRRIQIPSYTTLRKLHRIVQLVMGWQDCHLHEFIIDGINYGEEDPEYDDFHQVDERIVRLSEVIKGVGTEFLYRYDFGDSWWHSLVVEKILSPEDRYYPTCTAGERACPPEDCGGTEGYQRLLKRYGISARQKSRQSAKGRSRRFDPNFLDIEAVNHKLQLW